MNTGNKKRDANTYTEREWIYAKSVFIISWFLIAAYVLHSFERVKIEIGLCHFVDCNLAVHPAFKIMLLLVALIAVVFYIIERRMLLSLCVLSVLSIVIFSAGNSNGIFYRAEILSMVLIAQFLAYVRYFFNPDKAKLLNTRFTYSIQVIAAVYVLSAYSKLSTSGVNWVFSFKEFALQVKKNIAIVNVNWGLNFSGYGDWLFAFFNQHPYFTISILTLSWFIEVFAFFMLLGKKSTMLYGGVLLIFHLSIFLVMFVYVPTILVCVFTFILNIPYLVSKMFNYD